jgi:flagellin-specific chaperone FliS
MARRLQKKRDAFSSLEQKLKEELGYEASPELGWRYNYMTHEVTPIKEKD